MSGLFFGIAGLFAGVMLGITATWMQSKSMNIGVDFGNLAVGIGTMAVAWVSFYANKRFLDKESAKTMAQFRINWINGLRNEISKFISVAISIHAHENGPIDIKNIMILNESKSKIRLNMQVSKHHIFLKVLDDIVYALLNDDKDNLFEKLLHKLHIESESILEEAWSRAKNGLDPEL